MHVRLLACKRVFYIYKWARGQRQPRTGVPLQAVQPLPQPPAVKQPHALVAAPRHQQVRLAWVEGEGVDGVLVRLHGGRGGGLRGQAGVP